MFKNFKYSVWLKNLGLRSKLVLCGREEKGEKYSLKQLRVGTFTGSGLWWQLPLTFFFSRMQMIKID